MTGPTPASAVGIAHRNTRRTLTVLCVVASLYPLLFLLAAAMRASYPLQLEWLEGGVLDAVGRVLHHQPVYARPTHLWVPFVYMPLYYYVGALACSIGRFGFEPLRWLGTGCTVGCFLLQGFFAARMAGSWAAGILAAGFFAALYATTGSWYDLARVDLLFTFLVLLGVYLSWRGRPAWAAGVFALAFCAKQTALIFGVCVLLHEYRRRAYLLRGLGLFAVLLVAVNFVFRRLYGPWYAYYTQYLPAHQALEPRGLYWFIARDLIYPSGLAIVLILLAGWWSTRQAGVLKDLPTWEYNRRLVVATTIGLGVGCFASRMHSGGSVNVTIPLDAWLAVLFGASVPWLMHRASVKGAMVIGSVALLQFVAAFRPPARYIPSAAAKQEAREELARIGGLPGDVYVFDNAVDVATAGKRPFANSAAVFDVLRADSGNVGQELERDLEAPIERREYTGLISSQPLDAKQPPTGAPKNYGALYALDALRLDSGSNATGAFASDPAHLFPRYLAQRK